MEHKRDEQIMREAKDGNLSGLRLLFERYNVALYNFYRKMGADKQVSEDLTQELFYRLIKYCHSFDADQGTFKSWVYQMARNIFTNHFSMMQKTTRNVRGLEDPGYDLSQTLHSSQPTVSDEHLEIALSNLTSQDRELIVLSRYAGFKYAEIAQMKGSSPGAVKAQMFRAMKELRAIYFKAIKL